VTEAAGATTTLVPNNTGGAITSASLTGGGPLPAGLSLNADGSIAQDGSTPSGTYGPYTILYGNLADSVSSTVTITVQLPVNPRFAYLGNLDDNTLSIFTVDASSGQLRHHGYAGLQSVPSAVAVDPGGKYVFVADSGAGTLSVLPIDPANGTVTVPGSSLTLGASPYALAVDPSGARLYVACQSGGTTGGSTGTIGAFAIGAGGTLTSIGTISAGLTPSDLCIDPTGSHLFMIDPMDASVSLFGIDPATGALTRLGTPVSGGLAPSAVAVSPTGTFAFVAASGSGDVGVYTIGASTGGSTGLVPGARTATGALAPDGLAVDPAGTHVYALNDGNPGTSTPGSVTIFSFDPGTSTLTQTGSAQTGMDAHAITMDPTGSFVYVVDRDDKEVELFQRDPVDGSLTLTGRIRGRSNPGALALATAGLPVTHVPAFAYLPSGSNPGTVYGYAVDPATGSLNPISGMPAATGASPAGIAVEPSNHFAYVSNFTDHTISQFSIGAGGSLSSLGTVDTSPVSGPTSIAADPSGHYVFLLNGNSPVLQAFAINLTQPSLGTLVSPAASSATVPAADGQIALDPSGRFVFVLANGDVQPFTFDWQTAALTSLPTAILPVDPNASGLAVDPSGRFLYVSVADFSGGIQDRVMIYSIDAGNGTLTPLPSLATVSSVPGSKGIAIDPGGRFAYVPGYGVGSTGFLSPFLLDDLTGILIPGFPVGPIPNGSTAMTVDPSSQFAYVVDSLPTLPPPDTCALTIYAINPGTGALTPVGSAATGPNPAGPLVITDSLH